MDKKGNPISDSTLLTDLVFPNIIEAIHSCVIIEQLCPTKLKQAASNLGVPEFLEIANPSEAVLKQMLNLILSNDTAKIRHVVHCYKPEYAQTVETMLMFHIKSMSNLYSTAAKEIEEK